ncbi:MAG TPA: hypothetical protein VEU96_22580 [Bryobacteraceae bacterium]|nr:hypothetical protein [Bryobacteraceae bacterium]
MSYRSILLTGALTLASTALLSGQTKAKGQSIPRTPYGKPDLQGVWTNATLTPLERPASVAGKATLTDAEAAVWEKKSADDMKKYDGKAVNPIADALGSGGTGGYNALFVDAGAELARVDGVKRTSLIIDPQDGKVPPITAEGRQRNMAMMRSFMKYDSVKDRPLSERCLVAFGSSSGPPMLPVLYNNNYQIVQTPDHVMILVEMVHDARIIRIGGTHAPANIRQWLGDSIGHWEGDTLVVDTTNFTNETRFRGSSENLHVVERFTRVDANTILYRATIDDPSTFSKAWTIEYPFLATPGPVYEYACHEGNYAMTDILGGARKAEQEKEKK